MPDFGGLPPDVTSPGLRAGPRPDPMTGVAIATELESFIQAYSALIAGSQGEGRPGALSEATAAVAARYLEWAQLTTMRVEQAADRLRAAVAAFEATVGQ